MTDWHAPVEWFAKKHGYRFVGDIAYCTVKAPFGRTRVDLWISNMGGGGYRNTVAGAIMDLGKVHCRASAKVVGDVKVEVRRRTLFDRLISRGVRIGNAEFDARYVALGNEESVRRFLRDDVVKSFVAMWEKTEGLQVEDGEVSLSGGQFSLSAGDLGLIVETVGTIAMGAVDPAGTHTDAAHVGTSPR